VTSSAFGSSIAISLSSSLIVIFILAPVNVYNSSVIGFVVNLSGISFKRERLVDVLVNLIPFLRVVRAVVLSFPLKLVDVGCVRDSTLAINLKD
jgi:hypothetical protein